MKSNLLLPLGFFALLIACTTTAKLEKSWADPSLKTMTEKPFKKVLVVAKMKDESSRRIAEDKMVAAVKNATAVQAYSYLTSEDSDQNILEQKMKKDGFDGIVSMQLKEVEKSTSYTPGTAYGGWYGGYRGYGGIYGSPGYYSEDKTYMVETNFYSLSLGKLLWSGTTSTVNPSKVGESVDQIIYTVKQALIKEGIIK